MSVYDYSSISATAQRLIDSFGRSIIKRSTVMAGDEWNPTPIDTDTTIKAVATSFKANEVDGTLIKSTDKQYLTYAEITTEDKIVDTEVLSVVNVVTIQTGDTKIIYKVQARIS